MAETELCFVGFLKTFLFLRHRVSIVTCNRPSLIRTRGVQFFPSLRYLADFRRAKIYLSLSTLDAIFRMLTITPRAIISSKNITRIRATQLTSPIRIIVFSAAKMATRCRANFFTDRENRRVGRLSNDPIEPIYSSAE